MYLWSWLCQRGRQLCWGAFLSHHNQSERRTILTFQTFFSTGHQRKLRKQNLPQLRLRWQRILHRPHRLRSLRCVYSRSEQFCPGLCVRGAYHGAAGVGGERHQRGLCGGEELRHLWNRYDLIPYSTLWCVFIVYIHSPDFLHFFSHTYIPLYFINTTTLQARR